MGWCCMGMHEKSSVLWNRNSCACPPTSGPGGSRAWHMSRARHFHDCMGGCSVARGAARFSRTVGTKRDDRERVRLGAAARATQLYFYLYLYMYDIIVCWPFPHESLDTIGFNRYILTFRCYVYNLNICRSKIILFIFWETLNMN